MPGGPLSLSESGYDGLEESNDCAAFSGRARWAVCVQKADSALPKPNVGGFWSGDCRPNFHSVGGLEVGLNLLAFTGNAFDGAVAVFDRFVVGPRLEELETWNQVECGDE